MAEPWLSVSVAAHPCQGNRKMNHVLILTASLLFADVAFSFEGPRLTVDPSAAPVTRTWADVKTAIAASIARTADGYFAYSHKFNDIGPMDTSGVLTDEELKTQFAMACILASPITVKGPAGPQLTQWLGDKMLMNVNNDKVARQGHVVAEQDGALVIVKYLWGMNNGDIAVAFYNPTDVARHISATSEELCLEGPVKWTDRFNPSLGGESASGLAFDVPAHGTRLVYASGKATLRRWYGRECAHNVKEVCQWPCVFAPAEGDYALVFRTHAKRPYRVKVNGLDLGEFRGESRVGVRLWRAENTICLSGLGAGAICGIELRTE